MKTKGIVALLGKYTKQNEEIMIQWWTKADVEATLGGTVLPDEVWTEAVEVWDNEPLGTREAGVLDCVFAAQTIVKDRRRKETAAKFKLIVNGETDG